MKLAKRRQPPTGRAFRLELPPIQDWPTQAACKQHLDFTEWDLSASDVFCRECPVWRECTAAGLTPRQIAAMP